MPVATVGDAATASMVVTDETIAQYAALTGDENPIHTDDDYAAETMFDGRIAHGILSAGAISAALAALPGDIVYLSQDLRFENPVRPSDTVEASVEVVEVVGGDRVRVETVADVTDGERVLSGEAVVLSLEHGSE
jgi:3-hydroxybutyryl-CoA dehydratase